MKILRLDLAAFGSLRGVTLDLASREPCLHVVYGPNEAGKSTALRAITGLFYGIPETTADTHSVKGPDLRVGALVCDARGRELHVVRRKGRKDTLRSPSGQPLAGADVSWLTAGVAEATFRSLFGLSFASLHAGAEELLGSSGDLGQSLFGAAVGGGRVRALIEALHDEADQLFRPRGQAPQLNAALRALEDAKGRSREQAIAAGAFSDQQAGIEAAELEEKRLQAERMALRTERSRLERARRVIPLLHKRTELQHERDALSGTALLPATASDARRGAQGQLREAMLNAERVQRELARLSHELESVVVPQALVELDSLQVDAVRDRLAGYRRALRELPRRREALSRAQHEMNAVLQRLGIADSSGDLAQLRIPKQQQARIREQLKLSETLAREARELTRAKQSKYDQLERERRALAQLWAAGSTAAEQLPLLTRFTLPSDQVAEQFERAFAEQDQAERTLRERRTAVETALEASRRDLEALSLSGALPSEAELASLRELRSTKAALLREALNKPPSARTASRASTREPLALLDEVIELAEQGDAVSDRLRREAGRVAEQARLTAELQSHQRVHEKLSLERVALEQQRQVLEARWQALFARAGISARPAREVRSLLVEQRSGERACEELERELVSLERGLSDCSERKRALQQNWSELAAALRLAEASTAAEMETTLELRAELFVRFDGARELERELLELERELRAFEADVQELCARYLPEVGAQAADSAAAQLLRAEQLARDALAKHRELSAELARWQVELEHAQTAQGVATRELSLLMQAAAVSDLPALELAERNSARAIELDAALAQMHDELLMASDGMPSEAALEALPTALDEVRARLAATEDALLASERESERVAHTLASLKLGLDRLRESHGAGDAALEASIQLETVRALAERYVRTRLAASVLKREVERYRERHRAPVLRAAGDLFAQLTLSSFTGLDVDYGSNDEPLLTCVRADGSQLSVEALSTGTRDQLYLALRLASIEHLASKQELMPLVLDDVLIHFDDDRARAALRVLGAFAATTQVLFFTHHRRLCELASSELAADRVRVHRLATAPGTLATLFS